MISTVKISSLLLVSLTYLSLSANVRGADCTDVRDCMDKMVGLANELIAQQERHKAETNQKLVEMEQKLNSNIMAMKVDLGKTLLYRDFPNNTLSVNSNNAFEFTLDRPGMLLANLSTHNNEGSSVGGGQHTISASSAIYVDETLCSRDTSAYFVFNGGTISNTTCIASLETGQHTVTFVPSVSSAAGKSKRWGKYVVLPISSTP